MDIFLKYLDGTVCFMGECVTFFKKFGNIASPLPAYSFGTELYFLLCMKNVAGSGYEYCFFCG